jgi:hypothetical protein
LVSDTFLQLHFFSAAALVINEFKTDLKKRAPLPSTQGGPGTGLGGVAE